MQPKNIKATKEHCVFCFDVLTAVLNQKEKPKFELENVEVPVFVTFHIDKEDLRGCIGTFNPAPLGKQLENFTLSSAFHDSRFPPISKDELLRLDVGVSFLVNFEKDKKWGDWEVGKHGIIIDFNQNGRDYGATFLPEVAQEQEWNQETTLQHLISKAGYRKDYKAVLPLIKLTTYESSKDKLSYIDYLEYIKNRK